MDRTAQEIYLGERLRYGLLFGGTHALSMAGLDIRNDGEEGASTKRAGWRCCCKGKTREA